MKNTTSHVLLLESNGSNVPLGNVFPTSYVAIRSKTVQMDLMKRIVKKDPCVSIGFMLITFHLKSALPDTFFSSIAFPLSPSCPKTQLVVLFNSVVDQVVNVSLKHLFATLSMTVPTSRMKLTVV